MKPTPVERGLRKKSSTSKEIIAETALKNQALPRKDEDTLIDQMLTLRHLNGWERFFLCEIKKFKSLGCKQREKLNQISARRLNRCGPQHQEPATQQMTLNLGWAGVSHE